MKKLKNILPSGEIHFYFIGFLLIFLGEIHYLFYLGFVVYLLFIRKRVNIKVFLIISSLGIISKLFSVFSSEITHIDTYGLVLSSEKRENYSVVEVLVNFKKYNINTNLNLKSGDIISIIGDIEKYRRNTYNFGINSYKYYLGNNIHGKIINYDISHLHTVPVPRRLADDFLSQYDLRVRNYFYSFFLGEKIYMDEGKSVLTGLGIISVFTLTGIHVNFLKRLSGKLFFHLDLSKNAQELVLLVSDIIFLLLTSMSYLFLRITLMSVSNILDKKYRLCLSSLDKKCIVVFFIFITCPYYIYNDGVFLSLIIIFGLELLNKKRDYSLLSKIIPNILIFFLTVPFVINFSNSINILSPLMIFIMILLSSYFIYPLLFVALLIPVLNPVYSSLFDFIDTIIDFLHNYNIFSIKVPSISIYLIILYYIFFIVFHLLNGKVKKVICILSSSVILFVILITSISPENKIIFLDVGQGDSTIITYNKKVIMVDCFNSSYEYLQKSGIRKVDLLILTHGDNDHVKEADLITGNLDVIRVIGNPYDDYDLINSKHEKVYSGEEIILDNIIINILGPLNDYNDSNENSLVFKLNINNMSVLFTGDMESKSESDIISKYNVNLKSDIYKVTHHGSYTDNQELFLSYVNPRYAIISVGYKNYYRLPNNIVLENMNKRNISVYRTDQMGSIEYVIDSGKWDFYVPY